jgi:Enolase C-terminal domain-like
VGDNVDIMADAYMGWNLEYARRILRMVAPYNMRRVEEPVISDDLHAYAETQVAQHRQHLGRRTRIHDPRLPRRPRPQGLQYRPDLCQSRFDLSDTAPGFGLTLKPVDANFKLTR